MSVKFSSDRGIAKTGQTVVYQAGDDGTYQAGYPKVIPRFVDNGDNTITDNLAKLMWIKQPQLIIPTDNGTIGSASPDWVTGHDYAINDTIYMNADNSSWYSSGTTYPYPGSFCRFRCNYAHTSGNFQTNFNSGYWDFEGYGNDLNTIHCGRGSWATDTDYKKADLIFDGSTYYYVCAVDHHSVVRATSWAVNTSYILGDIRHDDISGTGWRCVTPNTSINFSNYTDGAYYSVNDVVLDATSTNNYYKCIASHTATTADNTVNSDEVANPFSWELVDSLNSTNLAVLFAFDRSLNSSNWVEEYSGITFANVLVDQPTYWIKTLWVGSATNPVSAGSAVNLTWSNAIVNIEALDYLGHTDWRMPNINELLAIMDWSKGDSTTQQPQIESKFIDINLGDLYWSSTTNSASTGYAWVTNYYYASPYYANQDKNGTNPIMICRDIT